MGEVWAVVEDVFFLAKLQETAKQVGAPLKTLRAADFRAEILRREKPALIIFDLNAASGDAVELIRRVRSDSELSSLPLVAFFSHVQVELQQAARAAGCEQILPRSKFTALLPELLRDYAAAAGNPPSAPS